MANTRELQEKAENIAITLGVELARLQKTNVSKQTVCELETALFTAINNLPDAADDIVYEEFIIQLGREYRPKVFENLKSKAALASAAKNIIDLAKHNQSRFEVFTVRVDKTQDKYKDVAAERDYFKKIYYHGLRGKSIPTEEADLGTALANVTAIKDETSKRKCSLDELDECNRSADKVFTDLNVKFNKFTVIDPLLPTQDPVKRNREKALLTALLKQQEEAIRHPGLLARMGKFFGWSVSKKIVAGKTYHVEMRDGGSKVKHKIRLTNDVLIQHEAIFNPHTLRDDLVARFRIINPLPLGKGKHGTTSASIGTIKLRRDGLESKHKLSRVIKEMHQHMKLKVMWRNDTPEEVQDEATVLRMLTPKATRAVTEKRGLFSGDGYIIDERFNGAKLSDYIKEQISNPASSKDVTWLTTVTSNLLYYLKLIHSANKIHHDVWTDNIMVNEKGDARIIDLGSARSTKKFIQFGGNHNYRPPEKDFVPLLHYVGGSLSFSPLVDQRSDIYMLGKSLLELWATNTHVQSDPIVKELKPILTKLQTKETKLAEMAKVRAELAAAITKINYENRAKTPIAKIVVLLATMVNTDSKLRPSLVRKSAEDKHFVDAIKILEDIRLDEKKVPQKVKDTFEHALQTQAELLKLQVSKSASISALRAILEPAIDKITDNSAAVIDEFINAVKIKSFVGIDSKDALKKKVSSILTEFNNNLVTLYNLHNQISATLHVAKSLPFSEQKGVRAKLEPLLEDINHRIHKARFCPLTLDAFNAFNHKMVKEGIIGKLEARLDDFDTNHCPAKVSKQCEILRKLTVEKVSDEHATEDKLKKDKLEKDKLKNAVKLAMRSYLKKDYAEKSKPNEERLKQMNGILNVLANDKPGKTPEDLKVEVKGALGKLGVFKRGSKLHAKVKDALKVGRSL